jgi:glyoxylase-like metal-dependent hydrolase (beta-lactamase superfamily II)
MNFKAAQKDDGVGRGAADRCRKTDDATRVAHTMSHLRRPPSAILAPGGLMRTIPGAPRVVEHRGDGVFSIDSGYVRERFDAVHLVVESGRAAIVDTGTRDAVPRVMDALHALGLEPADVDWVVLTHVHLDHAGGAGHLMRRLPAARLAVHPRGAPHVIDPRRLWAGTIAVYGEAEALATYGEPVPVPADRVTVLEDGATLSLAGRTFESFDAPGHALHHLVLRDAATGGLFTGDTFGISYRELDADGRPFAFPSSTPTQFDPAALARTLRRLLALGPPALYLTHWSRIDDVARVGDDLLRRIDLYVALAETALAEAGSDDAALAAALECRMGALLHGEARAHGCAHPEATLSALLAMDVRLNAAGLHAWLRSRARRRVESVQRGGAAREAGS